MADAAESSWKSAVKPLLPEWCLALYRKTRRPPQRPPTPFARVPYPLSPELRRYIDVVQPFTMSDEQRLATLYGLAKETIGVGIIDDVVECGVRNGGSAALIGAAVKSVDGVRLWLYDTFAGIPEPSVEDGSDAQQFAGDWVGTMDKVHEVMSRVGFPEHRLSFRKGTFQETFQQSLPQRVAFLHIDADWYESVLLTLNTFYDRVLDGSPIVLDDFGHWEGTRKAFYEFCRIRRLQPLLERVGATQAFWIKGRKNTRDIVHRYNDGCYEPAVPRANGR
jgi:O-methyltransferase